MMDPKVLRMYSPEGFRELFLEELADRLKEDPATTRESVFNMLNDKWHSIFGSYRYSNYDCFRKLLEKSYKKTK